VRNLGQNTRGEFIDAIRISNSDLAFADVTGFEVIPEPSTVVLTFLGAVALVFALRRRN